MTSKNSEMDMQDGRLVDGPNFDVATAHLNDLFSLAEILYDKGNRQDAAYAYFSFVGRVASEVENPAACPHFAEALERAAFLLSEAGKTQLAIETYDQIIRWFGDASSAELSPQVAHAFYCKGVLKREQDNAIGALSEFEHIIEKCGHASDPVLRRYVALALHGRGAVQCRLAAACNNQSQFDDGMRAFVRLIEQFSDEEDPVIRIRVARALKYVAEAYRGNGDAKRACAMFGEIVRRFGTSQEGEGRAIVSWAIQSIMAALPSSFESSLLEEQLKASEVPHAKLLLSVLQISRDASAIRHKSALEHLLHCLEERSAFVLYLRNFAPEASNQILVDRKGYPHHVVGFGEASFERDVLARLGGKTPIVGIANVEDLRWRPDEWTIPKLQVPGFMWVHAVRALIREAKAIILNLDDLTPGVDSELAIVREQRKEDATVVFIAGEEERSSLRSMMELAVGVAGVIEPAEKATLNEEEAGYLRSLMVDSVGAVQREIVSANKAMLNSAGFPTVLCRDDSPLDHLKEWLRSQRNVES